MEENQINEFFDLYSSELAKIRLIGLNNYHLNKDFPESIPVELREIWKEGFKLVMDRFETSNEESKIPNTIPSEKSAFIQPLSKLYKRGNDALEKQQLLQISFQQEFIMYLAYIEAYFQDYRRILYKIDPLLLSNKDKTCTWEEIIENKTIEGIQELLIEKSLEKSGYDKLDVLIEKLNNKPFLMKIRIQRKYIEYLAELIIIRNMIIHNNAKVTNEYLKIHPKSRLKFGDTYQLDFELMFIVYNFLTWITFESFAALKAKYFDHQYDQLCQEYGFIENYNPDLTPIANRS